MTAIDFPNSPTLNQTFSASGRTWKWNGATWETVASTTIAPTAHASSHASGGADAVTIAQSQVTNLTTDLAAKASTTDLAAKASLAGVETLTNKTLTSPSLNGAAKELAMVGGGFAGYSFYVTTNGAVQMLLGAYSSSNGIVNITSASGQTLNSIMAVNQVMTVTMVTTNLATGYYVTGVQVDGTSPAGGVRWAGGTAPTSGNANSYDVYTFTVLKYADAAFNVMASLSKFA